MVGWNAIGKGFLNESKDMERKLIIAIMRPLVVDKLVVAFENIENFPGITVVEAHGFGQRVSRTRDDTLNPFHPKKQIEIAAPVEMVEEIIEAIHEHAHTGKTGDGMIFVLPLEMTVRI